MEKAIGAPRCCLASSVTEKTLVANSEEQLNSILVTLEDCRAALAAGGCRESAQLVSMAILELRIKLNRIEDSELKELCDTMVRDEASAEHPREVKPAPGQGGRLPVSLRLVK